MQRQSVRVLLASEYSQARHFLREMVEEEEGNVIVGQAENAPRALTLAKHLRPDVAIIDCDLPHAIGLDTVPLSRIGGLDAAQTISEQIPNIKVILLNNLDTEILTAGELGSDVTAIFAIERVETSTLFTLQDLYREMAQPNALVFANVEAKPRASIRRRVASLSSQDLVFGGLSILGGLGLIAVLLFAGAWVVVALAGAVAIGFGIGHLWKRVKQGTRG